MSERGHERLPLTDFQLEVARLFFSLPASQGFLLAGGGALAAQGLTTRATQDLDFFTSRGRGVVSAARDDFEQAATARGWVVERLRDQDSFCRLVVHGAEELLVDLALDSPPHGPGAGSVAGPTFAIPELAGRKVVALFDRAEARDFTDVYALTRRFSKAQLLTQARLVDLGFDTKVFSQMLATLSRFTDADLPVPEDEVHDLRAFFAAWASELTDQGPSA